MKKIILPIGALLFSGAAHGQLSQNENYVYTKTYLSDPSGSQPKVSETVQYVDGLGRPKQVVNIKGSPLNKDIVTPIVYDEFGRQRRDYLPVPQMSTNNGAIYGQASGQVDFPVGDPTGVYTNEKAFSEKILENSPLDKILEQKQVGSAWQNKPVKFEYGTNAAGDVRKYVTVSSVVENSIHSELRVSGSGDSDNGYYPAVQLYKNTVKDEDENETIEFKNGKGQIILVRKVVSATENADTYYIYNEYGQLAFVVPPKASVLLKPLGTGAAVSETVLNDLCYQYRYDGKGRVVEKKLPGKGWEEMVYNKADLLILSRDARLKAGIEGFTPANSWHFIKYDTFGREAYTGISIDSRSRQEIQASVESTSAAVYEQRRFTVNLSGLTAEYSNFVYPTSMSKLLTVTYYDKYPTLPSGVTMPSTVMTADQEVLSDTDGAVKRTTGLPVASFVKNIEDDNWTKTFSWYDKKGRVVGTHSVNHLGGYTKTESELDFTGLTKQVKTYHKRSGIDTEKIILENFTYDSQNRLMTHTHQVDGNSVEILAQNTYNELSQLSGKKVGGISASTPLQDISYAYNIRGWMTKINDPKNLNGKLFGYEIKYNNPIAIEPKFNGNIAEVDWKTLSDNNLKRYDYRYDALNRLMLAHYREPDSTVPYNNFYNEEVSYDINGNITFLKRNRQLENFGAQLMDDLTYVYSGNQLNTVTDSSSNYFGYPEASGNLIHYDANGNMTDHLDKGILDIQYNFLNLPNYVKFDQYVMRDDPFGFGLETKYKNTTYKYRADGVKLKKVHNYFTGRTQLDASTTTEYLDGFQYNSESGLNGNQSLTLQFVPTSEGYFDFIQNKYIYQYKDQIGNVRLSYYKDADGNPKMDRKTDYYPFGLEFGGSLNIAGSVSPTYTYAFQEQEKQLDTGWSSFKWRNYDPTMGRFFNIDPLSEKYSYQSHYNFSENRVVDGRELEGLEWTKSTDLKSTHVHTVIRNHSSYKGNLVPIAEKMKSAHEKAYSINGVKATYSYEFNQNADPSKQYVTTFEDPIGQTKTPIKDEKGYIKGYIKTMIGGLALEDSPLTNNVQVVITKNNQGDLEDLDLIGQRSIHEHGHGSGLPHSWEKNSTVPLDKATQEENAMNSSSPESSYPVSGGTNTTITPQQIEKIINNPKIPIE